MKQAPSENRTETAALPSYKDLLPEIERRYGEGTTPLKTLTALGFKRTEDAIDSGHICVRPPSTINRRSIAGLWLSQEDINEYLAIAESIYSGRRTLEEKKRQAELERRQRDAERHTLIENVSAELALRFTPEEVAKLAQKLDNSGVRTQENVLQKTKQLVGELQTEKARIAARHQFLTSLPSRITATGFALTEEEATNYCRFFEKNERITDEEIYSRIQRDKEKAAYLQKVSDVKRLSGERIKAFDVENSCFRFAHAIKYKGEAFTRLTATKPLDAQLMKDGTAEQLWSATKPIIEHEEALWEEKLAHAFESLPQHLPREPLLSYVATLWSQDPKAHFQDLIEAHPYFQNHLFFLIEESLVEQYQISLLAPATSGSTTAKRKNKKQKKSEISRDFQVANDDSSMPSIRDMRFIVTHGDTGITQKEHISLSVFRRFGWLQDTDEAKREMSASVREYIKKQEHIFVKQIQTIIEYIDRLLQVYDWREKERLRLIRETLKLGRRLDDRLCSVIQSLVRETSLIQASKSVWERLASRWGDKRSSHMYRLARSLQRRLIVYAGPTNSGKTHSAFEHLATANSGAYLAPLRLLALEGQEKMLEMGLNASLLTGEERELREGSRFIASTVEMCDFSTVVDVAIVDEAQMLKDRDRGWAWLAAIMGVPAKEVIMTCSPDAVSVLETLSEYLEEPIEIREKQRFNELVVDRRPTTLDDLDKGTALVAFSRREVLEFKAALENRGKTVAVVYGALGPEVRREQARKFREGEADVLVSTDAIAMGLNLPIHRIVFSTSTKYNGKFEEEIGYALAKQIAGRAGRYGMFERGHAGGLDDETLSYVRRALRTPLEEDSSPLTLMPNAEIIEAIADGIKTERLYEVLVFFKRFFVEQNMFLPAPMDELLTLAQETDKKIDLSLREKFLFSCAPVNVKSERIYGRWSSFLDKYAKRTVSHVWNHMPRGSAANPHELMEAEDNVQALSLYRWIGYRFPEYFPDMDEAEHQISLWNNYINKSLEKNIRRKCGACGKTLPLLHRHANCDTCFRAARRSRAF